MPARLSRSSSTPRRPPAAPSAPSTPCAAASGFLDRSGVDLVAQVEPAIIDDRLRRHGLSPVSRRNDRRELATFLRWCKARGYVGELATGGGDRVTLPWKDPGLLTPDQARALMAAALDDKPSGGSIAYYFARCLFAGLRPSEAIRLSPAAVDLKGGEIRLVGTKTGSSRRSVTI